MLNNSEIANVVALRIFVSFSHLLFTQLKDERWEDTERERNFPFIALSLNVTMVSPRSSKCWKAGNYSESLVGVEVTQAHEPWHASCQSAHQQEAELEAATRLKSIYSNEG